MAPPRLPFDFDLNELPPPEDDAVVAATPSPAREPSPRDQLPPPSQVLSPSPPENDGDRDDASPAAPVPEPSAPQDQLVPASPLLGPYTSLPPPPPPVFGLYGFPALARELSPRDRYSSPVMDLESSLSLLDEEEEEEEEEDADTSRPSPESSAAHVSSRVASDAARLSPEISAARVSSKVASDASRPSRETSAARVSPRGPSDAASSHRSRHRPSYAPRDDAISKRRGDHEEEEDARSSRGRTGPAPPRRHDADCRGRAPAAHGQQGEPRRNWRRRQLRRARRQLGHGGQGQRRQEQPHRGREQQPMGFRGPERPQAHHDGHCGGPHGRASPEFPPRVQQAGYRSSFRPPPSAGPHGRNGSSRHGRQSQVQPPPPPPPAPKVGGGYHHQHREREVSAFRPHGREDSSGRRRQAPAAQEAPNGSSGYEQPRRHGPARSQYHPYARDGGLERANAGKHDRANYQHRRDSMKSTAGGHAAAHARQYYGDVCK